MDASNLDPLALFTLQQLLAELEDLLTLEGDRIGKPWISASRLAELFTQQHGMSPEAVGKAHGFDDSLRNLLKYSGCFLIYATPSPQEFYIAPRWAIIPIVPEGQRSPRACRVKRSWRVNGQFLRSLRLEEARRADFYQAEKEAECQPIQLPEINLVDDLAIALKQLIGQLTAKNPQTPVTIAALSRQFSLDYQQPIRPVLRTICPGLTLISLLQMIPDLVVTVDPHGAQSTVKLSAQLP